MTIFKLPSFLRFLTFKLLTTTLTATLTSTLTLGLLACSKSENTAIKNTNAEIGNGILGGTPVIPESRGLSDADYVVGLMFFTKNPGTNESGISICTGTLIEPDLVLTAAHCLMRVKSPLNIAIRFNEKLDAKDPDMQLAKDFVFDTRFLKNQDAKFDVGLVKLSSPAPEWKKVAKLPNSLMELKNRKAKISFNAVGYGLETGATANRNRQALGVLREVGLIGQWTPAQDTLKVDQSSGRGICQGDSGGPALYIQGRDTYVIGIAHAVGFERVPLHLILAAKYLGITLEAYLRLRPNFDICAIRGEYTSVFEVLEFIEVFRDRL